MWKVKEGWRLQIKPLFTVLLLSLISYCVLMQPHTEYNCSYLHIFIYIYVFGFPIWLWRRKDSLITNDITKTLNKVLDIKYNDDTCRENALMWHSWRKAWCSQQENCGLIEQDYQLKLHTNDRAQAVLQRMEKKLQCPDVWSWLRPVPTGSMM